MSNERRGKSNAGRFVFAGVLGLVLVAAAVYVGGYLVAGDDVPQNSSVAGVRIGGMTPQQAADKLEREVGPKANEPITIAGPGKSVTLTPADAGLTLDYPATVDQAGAGRSWDPTHIYRVLRGGGDIAPVYVKDAAKLSAAIAKLAPDFAIKTVEATVALKGADVSRTGSVTGQALDVPGTTSAVLAAWPDSTQVQAKVTSQPPVLTTEEVDQAIADILEPALAAPVTLNTARGDIVITERMIAGATRIDTTGGEVKVTFDQEALWKGLQPALKPLQLSPARDAGYTLVGGKPAVLPAKPGDQVAKADVLAATIPLLPKPAPRTGTVKIIAVQPKVTTAQAATLGVKEVIGEFTTQFPYAEYRNNNLSKAAASINGSYVPPGEIWSFNQTLGERTPANGYLDGYVINGGRLVKEPGGGVSQAATTTFNAYFFAGMQDIEHHPHTLYFSRYPAGREATVYYGSLDLRFKNNTPYGVLMQAYVQKAAPGGQGSITVRIWSTRQYTIRSSELVKSNFYSGTKRVSTAANCVYQAPAQGFTVNYSRLFYKGSTLARSEPFSWTYSAADEIICK